MAIRNAKPLPFLPAGVADAIDQIFPGACMNLQNLVFDRTNRGAVIPRPGVTQVTNFAGFTSPGVVSIAMAVGTTIYGMIATGRNVGFDEPFAYNTATGTYITVSGVTSANVPTTQSTTGAWTPPTMDVIGTKVVVTHPGFSGSNFIGWFDITTPSAPAWSAGNTTTTALSAPPQWVANFYGRAYYGVGNKVVMSDVLNATTIGTAAAAAALTLGDSSSSTGACGLPLNASSGGILQSLIVFKANSVWQITGDPTGSTLALNSLANNIGCISPRTAVATPLGIMFVATDGPRLVNLGGEIQYLQLNDSQGCDLVSPFAAATYPSRMCGAYNNSVYRVAFDVAATVWNASYTSLDYWFDGMFQRWNGVHTFPYHLAIPVGKTFYLASNSFPGALFQSDVVPISSTVYTDNGSAFTCVMVSGAMAGPSMAMASVVESTMELVTSATTPSYYIVGFDDQNNPLSVATISLQTPTPVWGSVKFGQFKWRNSQYSSHHFTIPWVNPLVFKKLILSVTVAAAQYVSIKQTDIRVQALGYTNV